MTWLEQTAAGGFPFLADLAIKGVILLAAVGLAILTMRKLSAAARHWIWFLAMAGLLALPILSMAMPRWNVLNKTKQTAPPPAPLTVTAPMIPGNAPPAMDSWHVSSAPPAAPMASGGPTVSTPSVWTLVHLETWALLIWAAGCILLLSRIALGGWWLYRLDRMSSNPSPAARRELSELADEIDLHRPVRLILNDHQRMPMTWGVERPVILLPAEAADWPAERRRAVLLHELAHVKRGDCFTQWIVQIACALHWFNPLAWLAWRRIQAERERACDDLVIGRGVAPSAYAEALVRVASSLSGGWSGAAGIAMARTSKLERRVRAILDAKRNRHEVGRAEAIAMAVLVGSVVGMLGPLAMVRAGAPVGSAPRADQPATDSAQRSKRPSMEPANNPWRRTMPGGTTIELVGISENPSLHKLWWRPDGSPLAKRPYEYMNASVAAEKNAVKREIAIHVNSPGKPVSFKWDLEGDSSSSTVKMDHAGNGFETAAVRLSAFQKTTTVRVGIADQPWKTITETHGRGGLTAAGMDKVNVVLSGAYVEKDGITVIASCDQLDQATRVVAIDLDGHTHAGAVSLGSAGKLVQTTTTFHGLTMERIKEFQFQMRPYHWVKFTDVAVYPNSVGSARGADQPAGKGVQEWRSSKTSQAGSRPSAADGRAYTTHGLEARATTADSDLDEKIAILEARLKRLEGLNQVPTQGEILQAKIHLGEARVELAERNGDREAAISQQRQIVGWWKEWNKKFDTLIKTNHLPATSLEAEEAHIHLAHAIERLKQMENEAAPATQPAKAAVPAGFKISLYDVRDMLVMNKGDEAYWPGVVPTHAQRVEQIIALIKAAIGPTSWEEPAKISELKGQLVIRQRPEVQKRIGQLIDRMRQGEKVDIVAHCIAFDQADERNLPRPLAEAMKTDFKNGAVLLNRQQADQAIFAASDTRMFDQKWAGQASDGKQIVVPHMELHNGQWSLVVIQTQRAYVAGFHPKEDTTEEVKYEPDIKTLLSGCYVDCQPLITANGHSIVLAIHSRISTLLDFEENRLWPNTRPEQKLFYQRPVMATRDLYFVGAVPRGMTLAVPFDPVVKTPADSKVQMGAAAKRRVVMLLQMNL